MEISHQHPMFLTYAEAAKELRVSISMIRKMAREQQLKVVHLGRAARIPRIELEKLCRN